MLVVLASVAACTVSKTTIARSPERTMTTENTLVVSAMEAVRTATAIIDGNATRQVVTCPSCPCVSRRSDNIVGKCQRAGS